MYKAEPPEWWGDARQMEMLLRGTWEKVSEGFLAEITSALASGAFDQMEELAATVAELGAKTVKALGNKPLAIIKNLEQKANAAWQLYGQEKLDLTNLVNISDSYREFISKVNATQIKAFTKANPMRILHPQLVRQIDYYRDARTIDVAHAQDVLERMVKQRRYWEGLSDTHISRLWHAEGIAIAKENGVSEGQISGPDDQKTCPVCIRMLGTRVNVGKAQEKFEADLKIEDPEEYVAAWAFPRILDIDAISQDERAAKGYLPPFHCRCRHWVAWLRK